MSDKIARKIVNFSPAEKQCISRTVSDHAGKNHPSLMLYIRLPDVLS